MIQVSTWKHDINVQYLYDKPIKPKIFPKIDVYFSPPSRLLWIYCGELVGWCKKPFLDWDAYLWKVREKSNLNCLTAKKSQLFATYHNKILFWLMTIDNFGVRKLQILNWSAKYISSPYQLIVEIRWSNTFSFLN